MGNGTPREGDDIVSHARGHITTTSHVARGIAVRAAQASPVSVTDS